MSHFLMNVLAIVIGVLLFGLFMYVSGKYGAS